MAGAVQKHAHPARPAPNTIKSPDLLSVRNAPARPGRAHPARDGGGVLCGALSLLVPSHLCKHSVADPRVVLARSLWADCIWKCYGPSQSHSRDCSGHREEKSTLYRNVDNLLFVSRDHEDSEPQGRLRHNPMGPLYTCSLFVCFRFLFSSFFFVLFMVTANKPCRVILLLPSVTSEFPRSNCCKMLTDCSVINNTKCCLGGRI